MPDIPWKESEREAEMAERGEPISEEKVKKEGRSYEQSIISQIEPVRREAYSIARRTGSVTQLEDIEDFVAGATTSKELEDALYKYREFVRDKESKISGEATERGKARTRVAGEAAKREEEREERAWAGEERAVAKEKREAKERKQKAIEARKPKPVERKPLQHPFVQYGRPSTTAPVRTTVPKPVVMPRQRRVVDATRLQRPPQTGSKLKISPNYEKLRQAGSGVSPLEQLVRGTLTPGVQAKPGIAVRPTTVPSTVEQRQPVFLEGRVREEPAMSADLERFIQRRGYGPVEAVGAPAWFWIGTRQGSEPSSNAWVVQLKNSRYGLAGVGDKTGIVRSKISYSSVEEALDAAMDIPGA